MKKENPNIRHSKIKSTRNNQKILENIYRFTDKDGLKSLSRTSHFFNQSINRYKIKCNLNDHNCDIKRFVQNDSDFLELVKWRDIIISVDWKNVKAWNAATGKELWNLPRESITRPIEKIWIVNEKIIWPSFKDRLDIIDIHTGKILNKITHLKLTAVLGRIIVVDDQIIAKLKNGVINCWDLSGELIKQYSLNEASIFDRILATKDYIVDIHYQNKSQNKGSIYIINRNNAEVSGWEFNTKLVNTLAVRNLLILNNIKPNFHNQINIIDMDKLKIRQLYENQVPIIPKHQFILTMVAGARYVFAADTKYNVYAIKISTGECEKLGNFCDPNLYLKDNFLLINYFRDDIRSRSICIWDITEMKKITNIDVKELCNPLWDSGQLFVADEKSIVKYDFNVTHKKGERLDVKSDQKKVANFPTLG